MSRIGKKPVAVPAKVQVAINGSEIAVKGPKGEVKAQMHPDMKIVQDSGNVKVERPSDSRQHRALHGLTRALINNMMTGVSQGFRRTLTIEGVGYRAEMDGKDLVLYVGYSHPVRFKPPKDVSFAAEDRTTVHVDGIDKQVVGQIAANIREVRPPEPYLGKGIRYKGEVIRRKAGKAGKAK